MPLLVRNEVKYNNMKTFKPITLKDIEIIKPYLKQKNSPFIDYSLGGRFMWREYFGMEYLIVNNDTLVIKNNEDEQTFFEMPIGPSYKEAFNIINAYCQEQKLPINYAILSWDEVQEARGYFKEILICYDRGWSDYLYDAQKFKEFKGKKYSKKRNHLNSFNEEHPEAEVIEINGSNIEELKSFFDNYSQTYTKESALFKEENRRVKEVLDTYNLLELFGIMIKVEGKIIGFSMGEIMNDTLYCHIEKAIPEIRGSYQKVAYEFAQRFTTDTVKWNNREEDSNDLGLRRSKLSYKPDKIYNKYMIEVISHDEF